MLKINHIFSEKHVEISKKERSMDDLKTCCLVGNLNNFQINCLVDTAMCITTTGPCSAWIGPQ